MRIRIESLLCFSFCVKLGQAIFHHFESIRYSSVRETALLRRQMYIIYVQCTQHPLVYASIGMVFASKLLNGNLFDWIVCADHVSTASSHNFQCEIHKIEEKIEKKTHEKIVFHRPLHHHHQEKTKQKQKSIKKKGNWLTWTREFMWKQTL